MPSLGITEVLAIKDIDSAKWSLDDKFGQAKRRSGVKRFFTWFVYIISCGKVSRNRSLDQTVQKVLAIAKESLRTKEIDHLKEDDLVGALTTLKAIVQKNSGKNLKQIQFLIQEIEDPGAEKDFRGPLVKALDEMHLVQPDDDAAKETAAKKSVKYPP